MFKYLFSSILLLFLVSTAFGQNDVSHEKWTYLLEKYVDLYGKVDYVGMKSEEAKLDEYLDLLSSKVPQPYWKIQSQEVYWVNAYNAFTVKLILKHYPIKSIRDIQEDGQDAWHIPFIKLGGKTYTLDYIEKNMIFGQFNDTRFHFVINCGAKSCPILKNEAYEPDNIDVELRLATKRFINDNRFNILSPNHLQVSQIFEWYKDEFVREEGGIKKYINKYTPHVTVNSGASLSFLKYNWNLNE